ncbi:MAG: DUF2505 domain-containing protein [Actinomycetia bacterium]|nr:DUF2505 domain-containing protein [Actinomycetes bacterium]
MPRSFDVTSETATGAPAVWKAFRDKAYWLARIANYGGDSMTLESLEVGEDGTVRVHTTQDLRKGLLPGSISRVLPGDTKIVRIERWRPASAGEFHGEFTMSAHGVPSSGSGTMVLKPAADGSSLRIRGTLEVRIPVMGGRIERYIADLVAVEVPQMQQFTAEWIAGEA